MASGAGTEIFGVEFVPGLLTSVPFTMTLLLVARWPLTKMFTSPRPSSVLLARPATVPGERVSSCWKLRVGNGSCRTCVSPMTRPVVGEDDCTRGGSAVTVTDSRAASKVRLESASVVSVILTTTLARTKGLNPGASTVSL